MHVSDLLLGEKNSFTSQAEGGNNCCYVPIKNMNIELQDRQPNWYHIWIIWSPFT